jgi:membrane glycosyltransferase
MTKNSDVPSNTDADRDGHSSTTPAGLQSISVIRRRRGLVVALNLATYVALLGALALILSSGGWTIADGILLASFAIASPWTVLGFWNALIGLWLLHFAGAPFRRVAPFAASGDLPVPLEIRTAILMTLRNEDPSRAFARLKTVKTSLDATGEGGSFDYFVLSDTSEAAVALAEQAEMAAWQAIDPDATRLHYRRRERNTGYKAGNLREFIAQWGDDYALMLPLDADSLMSGETILRMTRMMQAHPRIGILQSLVVGMPSSSAFARIFQFGMRHGMRAYTMGQAWWVADCGPFWGHNALVRIQPFAEHCDLPMLPGAPPLGGHVLSHDQVEATLMRRGGYEVRVLPEERGSWEENPPTLADYMKRDARWCQGNLQYLKLLDTPGLHRMSRFQLIWAIMMFIGVPAWTLMIALAPVIASEVKGLPDFPSDWAAGLYTLFLVMSLMPKLAGMTDVVLTTGGTKRYGGHLRFALSVPIELVFSFLQGAVSTINTTIFMAGLLLGRSVVWGGQARDAYGLSWRHATALLWPQLLFGLVVCGALVLISPITLYWSLPLTAGYLLAIPFAVITASPRIGAFFRRAGLCGIPEDFELAAEIEALRPAKDTARRVAQNAGES